MRHQSFSKRDPPLTNFVRSLLDPLLELPGPFVSPEYMQENRIRHCYLDLKTNEVVDARTGKPDPNARHFTRPIPQTEMAKLLEKTKPWISSRHNTVEQLTYDEDLDGWWHAHELGLHLDMYLSLNRDERELGVIDSTKWEQYR